MFSRKDTPAPWEPESEHQPPPAPPAERRPMRDADCLKPSTFASRKAASTSPASRPRNIVSLGFDKKLFRDRRNQDVWLDVELGVDWNNRNHRYYRVVGDTIWEPTFETGGNKDQVEKLGSVDPRERFQTSTYRPADPDPRPIPLTELG